MLGEPPETLVLHGSEQANSGDPGTSAVLAGLMSMLSEVLDNLEVRLGALEERVGAVLAVHGAAREEQLAALEAGVEAVVHRAVTPVLTRLEQVEVALAARPGTVEALRDGLGRRLDEIEARMAGNAADLAAAAAERGVGGVLTRLGSLEATVGERAAGVVDALTGEMRAALGRATSQLEERLRGLDPTERAVAAMCSTLQAELPRVADAVRATPPAEPAEHVASVARGTARSLARLEAGLAELRAENGLALRSLAGRLDELEVDLRALRDLKGPGASVEAAPPDGLLDRMDERLGRLEYAVAAHDESAVSRQAQLSTEVQSALAAATERVLLHVSGTDEALVSDVRASLARLRELGGALDAVATDVAGVAGTVERIAAEERLRPLLETLEVFGREHRDALSLAQAALSRRIDAGVATVVRVVDSVAGPVQDAADAVRDVLGEHRGHMAEVRAGVDALGEWVERLPTEAAVREGLDALRDTVGAAASGDRYERLRHEMGEALAVLHRRHATTAATLERLSAWLDDQGGRLEAVHSVCQSLATTHEQSATAGGRLAELLLETRCALRADMERLESTVQLESVKHQQQGSARLAQAAAGVTDVVERENAILVQRVTALATAVDAVRTALLVHAEETAHGARGRSPLQE